jgi:uncharacterized membrane protein HdeD (DUF308 family)
MNIQRLIGVVFILAGLLRIIASLILKEKKIKKHLLTMTVILFGILLIINN